MACQHLPGGSRKAAAISGKMLTQRYASDIVHCRGQQEAQAVLTLHMSKHRLPVKLLSS